MVGILSQDDDPRVFVRCQAKGGIDVFRHGINGLILVLFIEEKTQLPVIVLFELFADDFIPVVADDPHKIII